MVLACYWPERSFLPVPHSTMQILLLHPEDDLQEGPWASRQWDRVIDLGKAGEESYASAAKTFGCAVDGLGEFRQDFSEMRRVRELMGLGLNRLNDSFGLDWWELTSIHIHQQFEAAFLMAQLAKTLGPNDEVQVSRPCFQADVLRLAIGFRLHTFVRAESQQRRGLRHYLKVSRKFPTAQLLEILWDKTDSGYQIRGALSARPKPQTDGVVLLPTAYGNVSRTATAYAESLPDVRFLLVATRRSGWMKNRPANVSAAWLRQYASVRDRSREAEHRDLVQRWRQLQSDMNAVPEFRVLSELGTFEAVPQQLATGLEIRDAWRNVFDSEPITGVICADDSNPSTHIPLLLAKHRGVPAIACHHGALDGRYMFKRNHADVLLAKGRMEEDYLVRQCGVPGKNIEIGAPLLRGSPQQNAPAGKSSIVFFSEGYEVSGGRTLSFYQDILPALADLALAEGKKLVIKLHPSESLAERTGFVQQILTAKQQQISSVVGGLLTEEILDDAWFGVTVMSTVVVECGIRGIPCFLCPWLESWPYGYVAQFGRFEAGIPIGSREKISEIPAILRKYKGHARICENCWTEIDPQRLRSLLGLNAVADDSKREIVYRSA